MCAKPCGCKETEVVAPEYPKPPQQYIDLWKLDVNIRNLKTTVNTTYFVALLILAIVAADYILTYFLNGKEKDA